MNLYEFNTDKMSWRLQGVSAVGYPLISLEIKFTDANYFNEIKPILLNLVNSNFKFILVDHTRTVSYVCDNVKFLNYDFVNQKFKSGTNKDNFEIDVVVRAQQNELPGTLNNYWLYVQYE